MVSNKRLAIENHSSDEIAVNYGSESSEYLTVQNVNLAVSSDDCSQVHSLAIRVYSLSHSNNLLFIDFRLTDPCGSCAIIHAGSMNKHYIKWTDIACSVARDFYHYSTGEDSLILTDNLAAEVYKLSRFVRHKKIAIPTSKKDKHKNRMRRYIER